MGYGEIVRISFRFSDISRLTDCSSRSCGRMDEPTLPFGEEYRHRMTVGVCVFVNGVA